MITDRCSPLRDTVFHACCTVHSQECVPPEAPPTDKRCVLYLCFQRKFTSYLLKRMTKTRSLKATHASSLPPSLPVRLPLHPSLLLSVTPSLLPSLPVPSVHCHIEFSQEFEHELIISNSCCSCVRVFVCVCVCVSGGC